MLRDEVPQIEPMITYYYKHRSCTTPLHHCTFFLLEGICIERRERIEEKWEKNHIHPVVRLEMFLGLAMV